TEGVALIGAQRIHALADEGSTADGPGHGISDVRRAKVRCTWIEANTHPARAVEFVQVVGVVAGLAEARLGRWLRERSAPGRVEISVLKCVPDAIVLGGADREVVVGISEKETLRSLGEGPDWRIR